MALVIASTAARPLRAVRSNESIYLAGKFLAQISQNTLLAALVVTAGTSADASIGLSGFFVAMLVPSLLLGPVGGAIVDRIGPARGYLLGAALRGTAVLGGLLLLGTGPWVWIVAALYSASSQVFTPAEFALVRHVQGPRPGRTYSRLTVMQYLGQGAGLLVIAPFLYLAGGELAVLGAAAAGFAALTLVAWRLVRRRVDADWQMATETRALSFGRACRFLATDVRASHAVVALTLCSLITHVLVVVLPLYLEKDIAIGSAGGLAAIAVPGIAGIVVGLVWAARSLDLERSLGMMRFAAIGLLAGVLCFAVVDYGVTMAARGSRIPIVVASEAAVNTTLLMVIPAAFLIGLSMATVLMSARFALTEAAPRGQHGRVHAVQLTLTEGLLVAPIMVAGLATAWAGTRPTLCVVAAVAAVALLAMEWRRRAFPVPSSEAPLPEAVVPQSPIASAESSILSP